MSASVYASLSVPADGQIFTVFCIEWDLFAYTLNKIEGNVIDPDLIDCYIYELNSVQMRYKFLLTSIRNYELRTQKNPEDFYTKNPLELSES